MAYQLRNQKTSLNEAREEEKKKKKKKVENEGEKQAMPVQRRRNEMEATREANRAKLAAQMNSLGILQAAENLRAAAKPKPRQILAKPQTPPKPSRRSLRIAMQKGIPLGSPDNSDEEMDNCLNSPEQSSAQRKAADLRGHLHASDIVSFRSWRFEEGENSDSGDDILQFLSANIERKQTSNASILDSWEAESSALLDQLGNLGARRNGEQRHIRLSLGAVASAVFHPCLHPLVFAAGNTNGEVSLAQISLDQNLDLASKGLESWKAHAEAVKGVEFVDGGLLSGSGDGCLRLFDLSRGIFQEAFHSETQHGLESFASQPDEPFMVNLLHEDGTYQFLDLREEPQLRKLSRYNLLPPKVSLKIISPNPTRPHEFAVAGKEASARNAQAYLFDRRSFRGGRAEHSPLARLRFPAIADPRHVIFSPDGAHILVSDGRQAYLCVYDEGDSYVKEMMSSRSGTTSSLPSNPSNPCWISSDVLLLSSLEAVDHRIGSSSKGGRVRTTLGLRTASLIVPHPSLACIATAYGIGFTRVFF